MDPSVFGDKASIPTDRQLEAALGPALGRWGLLKARLALDFDPLLEGWSFGGRSHGWSLRLEHRHRAIVYLTPLAGRFRASLALPERAMPAALQADLPEPVKAIVASAPTYPEGRAIRIGIETEEDVASLVALARIRMAS